jgi:L-arabinose isomerase
MSKIRKTEITSFDAAECGAFGDVLSESTAAGVLKVGLLGLGYFEYWRMYPQLQEIVRKDLDKVFKRLVKSLDMVKIIYPGMVDTLDRAETAGAEFASAGVEIIIVFEGTYIPDFITLHALNRAGSNPKVILVNTQTGCDVCSSDNYMATMRNSALIGVSQLTGSFRKMKREYEVVSGEISDPEIYHEIRKIVQAYSALRRLKKCTYGLIGHVFRGMYDLEFDTAKVKGFLGPEVMTIQAEHLIELWNKVGKAELDNVSEKLFKRFRSKKIDIEDVKRSCRIGLAMEKLKAKFNLDGLCFLGQHYIEKMTGAPARIGASMMLERNRTMVACEGDIAGLVMMQLMYEFTGNIPFQAEWGQFDRKNNALFLLGHGIGAPEMAGGDNMVTLSCSPEEWGFKGSGLNYEMIMKPGPVTMGHFLNVGESWRMLISEGEAIKFPCLPCDEIHAMVKVETPVEDYIRQVLKKGAAHHLIVVHGQVAGELEKAADMMQIEKFIIK